MIGSAPNMTIRSLRVPPVRSLYLPPAIRPHPAPTACFGLGHIVGGLDKSVKIAIGNFRTAESKGGDRHAPHRPFVCFTVE